MPNNPLSFQNNNHLKVHVCNFNNNNIDNDNKIIKKIVQHYI